MALHLQLHCDSCIKSGFCPYRAAVLHFNSVYHTWCRYRLMVRRCMEGNRRLGTAQLEAGEGANSSGHQLLPVACEAEITECLVQPDGRYLLEIVGRRRVDIESSWEQDGYRMATCKELADDGVEDGSEAAGELGELSREVEELVDGWLARIQALHAGRRSTHIMEFLER